MMREYRDKFSTVYNICPLTQFQKSLQIFTKNDKDFAANGVILFENLDDYLTSLSSRCILMRVQHESSRAKDCNIKKRFEVILDSYYALQKRSLIGDVSLMSAWFRELHRYLKNLHIHRRTPVCLLRKGYETHSSSMLNVLTLNFQTLQKMLNFVCQFLQMQINFLTTKTKIR